MGAQVSEDLKKVTYAICLPQNECATSIKRNTPEGMQQQQQKRKEKKRKEEGDAE